MSKLSAIHKQIAALQAEAERITKQEVSAAIAKVKNLMSEFGLTIEHLTQSVAGKPAAKKAKAAKAKTASVAKYADPKTGKTWSGFGRAPAWIAGAKNRDEFLVGAAKAAAKPAAAKKKAATKAAVPAQKRVKAKASPAAKPAAKKKPATKAPASKKIVKPKAVAKKAAPRKVAASANASSPLEAAPTAA